VVRHDDLAVHVIEHDAVRIGEPRLRTADVAQRQVGPGRRALEDIEPVVLLAGDRQLVALQAERQPPRLVRRLEAPERLGVAVCVVGKHAQAAAVVADRVDLAALRIQRHPGHEAHIGIRSEDITLRLRDAVAVAAARRIVAEKPAAVLVGHHHDAVLAVHREPVVRGIGVVDQPQRLEVAAAGAFAGPLEHVEVRGLSRSAGLAPRAGFRFERLQHRVKDGALRRGGRRRAEAQRNHRGRGGKRRHS
jgi:hypothetical protein